MKQKCCDTMILEIDITKCNIPIRKALDLIITFLSKNNLEVKNIFFDKEELK